MLNLILLNITSWVVTLATLYIVYRVFIAPSKRELMNRQAEQLESIRDLLAREELNRALDKRREELAKQNK